MKIVALGGTGLIGSKVVNLLRADGHEVVAASPAQGINSITREGLTEALTGAQVVQEKLIKASSIPYTIVRATQFFEFVGRIADEATSGQTVRLPSVLFQPIFTDDLAANLAKIAVAKPLNGTIELAGPDALPFD